MSLKLVIEQIVGFIESAKPSVLCLRGPWGVGKTYNWDTVLLEKLSKNKVGLESYAYVSLFGVNSLEALKTAIFENTVKTSQKTLLANEATLEDLLNESVRKGRQWFRFIEGIPLLKSFAPSGIVAALAFLSVRKTLICFDDLERRGKGLDLADVLGLTSMLKERRECSVVLLLNEEKMEKTDQDTFNRYLEKVSDASLRFNPTSEEAVSIASSGNSPISGRTAELCSDLGIRNIRVMKKIQRNLDTLKTIAGGCDARVLGEMERSTALFSWSHHEPDEGPPLAFLKTYNGYRINEAAQDAKSASWRALLSSYGYSNTNELDLSLMQGVENGYFDTPVLLTKIGELEADFNAADADKSFEEAWKFYHDSFDDNTDEVLKKILSAFKANAKRISPTNLNGTVRLFKDLGKLDCATDLLKFYMEERSDESRRFFNLNEYAFRESITEQEVIDAFEAKAVSVPEERDFSDLLAGLRKGWNPEDLDALSGLSVGDYKKLFKEKKGKALRQIISGALSFDSVENASPEMLEISKRATKALQQIAKESLINARRVTQLGISLDETAADTQVPEADGPSVDS